MNAPASPVDWGRAERVATLIAARRPAPLGDVAGWDPPMEQIEQQIEDVTGLRSAAGTATAQLIDRPAWIHANIVSFRALLAPVFEKLEAKRTPGAAANAMTGVSRQIAGA